MLIIQLLAFAAVAVWGFGYYLKKTTRPAETPESIPEESEEGAQPQENFLTRAQLEKTAQDLLLLHNVKFNTFYYVKSKTDLELMDIIKDYNIL